MEIVIQKAKRGGINHKNTASDRAARQPEKAALRSHVRRGSCPRRQLKEEAS